MTFSDFCGLLDQTVHSDGKSGVKREGKMFLNNGLLNLHFIRLVFTKQSSNFYSVATYESDQEVK